MARFGLGTGLNVARRRIVNPTRESLRVARNRTRGQNPIQAAVGTLGHISPKTKRGKIALGAGIGAMAATAPIRRGPERSQRNQSSRPLQRIRANQAVQFDGLQGGIRPRSSGGYTL